MPALHTGIFYDKPSLEACLELFEGVDYESIWNFRKAVPREGLSAQLGRHRADELMLEVIKIARVGLSRWEPGSEHHLDLLEARLRSGRCPADEVREQWDGDIGALFQRTRIA